MSVGANNTNCCHHETGDSSSTLMNKMIQTQVIRQRGTVLLILLYKVVHDFCLLPEPRDGSHMYDKLKQNYRPAFYVYNVNVSHGLRLLS